MLHSLIRTMLPQANQRTTRVPHAVKCIDATQLKLVAGGLPRGGWLETESAAAARLPRGGW